jgi:DNA modification methylase
MKAAMPELSKSRRRDGKFSVLDSIDWGFSRRIRQDDLEAIHPYPAKFIPELPGTILQYLPVEPGSLVLDPFVGSGTTLVESQKRGMASIGIDVNPIACLISRVKVDPLPENAENALDAVLSRALNINKTSVPAIPNLDHWFSRPIQKEVARLVTSIEQASSKFHDIFNLALSSILVRVSNQDSDTRYAAVEKNIHESQVPTFFATAARRIILALQHRPYALAPSTVLTKDTLAVSAKEIGRRVGAVITSPPYPNAYEYWLYHKYRMFWLGHDPLRVKEREIGARAHFFKTNHHTADNFTQQMRQTFELIDDVLLPNGYVCFVVGRSKIHGKIIDNANVISGVAEEFGFRTRYRAERIIAANRKSFNLSHANIKTETILILAR